MFVMMRLTGSMLALGFRLGGADSPRPMNIPHVGEFGAVVAKIGCVVSAVWTSVYVAFLASDVASGFTTGTGAMGWMVNWFFSRKLLGGWELEGRGCCWW